VYAAIPVSLSFTDLVFMAALTADDRADALAREVRRKLFTTRTSATSELPAIRRLFRKMIRLSKLTEWAKRRYPRGDTRIIRSTLIDPASVA